MVDEPFFSVVVPTRGRPEHLRECLRGFAKLDYPRNRFEVTVVEDGDGTASPVIADFAATLDVIFVAQSWAGPAAARNAGAERTKGEFLAFVDDDCVPRPQWLTMFANALRLFHDVAVSGRIVERPHDRWSRTTAMVVERFRAQMRSGEAGPRFLESCNFALPRSAFFAVGGFDTRFNAPGGEDREFSHRWLSAGLKVRHEERAIVDHDGSAGGKPFIRRHFNYGRGSARYRRIARARVGVRPQFETLRFYLELFGQANRELPLGEVFLHAALVAASQIATFGGYLLEALSGPFRRTQLGLGIALYRDQ